MKKALKEATPFGWVGGPIKAGRHMESKPDRSECASRTPPSKRVRLGNTRRGLGSVVFTMTACGNR